MTITPKTVWVSEIYDAVNDREAVMDFLEEHQSVEYPANDPCGCIFHQYLAERFGIDTRIYYDEITIEDQDGTRVNIRCSFASAVQQEWTSLTDTKYPDADSPLYTDDGDPIVLTGEEALEVVERMEYETRR